MKLFKILIKNFNRLMSSLVNSILLLSLILETPLTIQYKRPNQNRLIKKLNKSMRKWKNFKLKKRSRWKKKELMTKKKIEDIEETWEKKIIIRAEKVKRIMCLRIQVDSTIGLKNNIVLIVLAVRTLLLRLEDLREKNVKN